MNEEIVVTWRLFNAGLASMALSWLLLDTVYRWRHLTKRRTYLTFALVGFLSATALGSVEAAFAGLPPRWATALTTTALLWTLFGLWTGMEDDREPAT